MKETGVFPSSLKSTNCGGGEQTQSPTRLFMRSSDKRTQIMYDRDGEMNFPKRSTDALFVGATRKINDATLRLLGGISGPCFTAPFHFLGI